MGGAPLLDMVGLVSPPSHGLNDRQDARIDNHIGADNRYRATRVEGDEVKMRPRFCHDPPHDERTLAGSHSQTTKRLSPVGKVPANETSPQTLISPIDGVSGVREVGLVRTCSTK